MTPSTPPRPPSTALARPPSAPLARPGVPQLDLSPLTPQDSAKLVDDFFQGLKPGTLAGYQGDLRQFAAFNGFDATNEGVTELAKQLFTMPFGRANQLVARYRADLQARLRAPAHATYFDSTGNERQLRISAATANRHLSSIRQLTRYGRRMGVITWTVDVKSFEAKPYRDTRGPPVEEIVRAIQRAMGLGTPRGARNAAALGLLFMRGLRSGEARTLEMEHLDFERSRVSIQGKKRDTREWVTLPPEAAHLLQQWLKHRGLAPGPVFTACRKTPSSKPLTPRAFFRTLRDALAAAGSKGRPHGLRHAAITQSLNENNGNVRDTGKFSRHSKHDTVLIYDDARHDVGGEISRSLGKLFTQTAAQREKKS